MLRNSHSKYSTTWILTQKRSSEMSWVSEYFQSRVLANVQELGSLKEYTCGKTGGGDIGQGVLQGGILCDHGDF